MHRRKSKFTTYKRGTTFMGFEVIENLGSNINGHYEAIFKCSCGNTFTRSFSNLKRNPVHGCIECSMKFVAESKRKYKTKDRGLYQVWKSMNNRCYNEENAAFKWYGAKGVSVCDAWKDTSHKGFDNFYADMGSRPFTRASVDRIDYDGDYELSNCRWATDKEQANNMSSNHMLTWEGEEYTLQLLAEKFSIKPNTLYYRLHYNWSLEEAISGKREKLWQRPYLDKLTDKEFEQVLILRYEGNVPIMSLAKLYGLKWAT